MIRNRMVEFGLTAILILGAWSESMAAGGSASVDLDSNAPQFEGLGRWSTGPVFASAVSGDFVYFGSGGLIRAMKIESRLTKTGPDWTEVGRIEIPGVVRDLDVRSNLLFVADDGGALRVIDISKPGNMREIGNVELPPFVRGVSVNGEVAYLATGWDGVQVVDVSAPDAPRVVTTVNSIGYILDIHVSGSLALISDSKSGIKLLDLSNPLEPQVLSATEVPGRAQGVHIDGQMAYVVSLEESDGSQVGGLAILDISNPANPRLMSFEPLNYGAERVWVDRSLAYLAGVVTDAGLIVVDVSNPSRPVRLGSYTHPTCSESVTVAGEFAYLSHGDQGLEIIDVRQPTEPYVIRHVDAAGHTRGVHVVGSVAFVANGYTGLRILDVSDTRRIREISHLGTYRALDVRSVGNYAYVADDWAGLVVVDISDLENPRKVAVMDTPGYAEAITIHGDRAYIADGEGGLRVADISDPLRPVEVAFADTAGYSYDVHVEDRLIYLADGKNGLRVFVDAKEKPVEIGHFNPENPRFEARGIDVNGRTAYLSSGYWGLGIIDFTNLRAPVVLAQVDISQGARSVRLSANHAYVGDLRGVAVFEVSDPTKPTQIGYHEVSANADRIWATGDQVYVATREAGLMIFNHAEM